MSDTMPRQITKDQLITYLVDCIGYGMYEVRSLSRRDLIEWVKCEGSIYDCIMFNS